MLQHAKSRRATAFAYAAASLVAVGFSLASATDARAQTSLPTVSVVKSLETQGDITVNQLVRYRVRITYNSGTPGDIRIGPDGVRDVFTSSPAGSNPSAVPASCSRDLVDGAYRIPQTESMDCFFDFAPRSVGAYVNEACATYSFRNPDGRPRFLTDQQCSQPVTTTVLAPPPPTVRVIKSLETQGDIEVDQSVRYRVRIVYDSGVQSDIRIGPDFIRDNFTSSPPGSNPDAVLASCSRDLNNGSYRIPASEDMNCFFDFTPSAQGDYVNEACVTYSYRNPLGRPRFLVGEQCSAPVTTSVVVPAPALSLTKVANPQQYSAVDQVITYTLTATNAGNVALGDVFIRDLANQFTGNGGTLDFASCGAQGSGVALAPGETFQCAVTYSIVQADLDQGGIDNNAQAIGVYNSNSVNSSIVTESIAAVQQSNLLVRKSPQAGSESFSQVGDRLLFDVSVENTGNSTLTSLEIRDDPADELVCPGFVGGQNLAPGAVINCVASYSVTDADIFAGSYTNIAQAQALDPNGASVNARGEATSSRRDEAIAERTERVINNFMARRANHISNGPDLVQRLRDRDSATSPLASACDASSPADSGCPAGGAAAFHFSGSGDDEQHEMAFSTTLRQVLASQGVGASASDAQNNGGATAAAFSGGGGDALGGFGAWVEGKWAYAEYDASRSDFGAVYFGVDYRADPDFVLGVLGQIDWTEEKDSGANFEISGLGWMVGPYGVARLHDNLFLDARAAWGQSSNDVNPLGLYEDSFDTTRWLARAQLTGDFTEGGWRFSPYARVTYFEESRDTYVDTLGITIDSQTVSLGRLAFGPEVSYTFHTENGAQIAPHVGVSAIWDWDQAEIFDLDTGDALSTDELRARLEGGAAIRMENGASIRAEGFYDGVGTDDLDAFGGSLKLSIPLN